MTDPRHTVQELLDLDGDVDEKLRMLEEQLDDAALELLTALCTHLSLAAAAARGKSLRRHDAHERAAEYAAGICLLLDIWQSADVEIVDGPCLGGALGFPMYD